MEKLIIKAEKTDGGYRMVAENGDLPQEGRVHSSRRSVYADCERMYAGDTWQGRKVKSGYEIVID